MPGARPGGRSGRGDERLEERPVEARVVNDDQVRVGNELARGRDVDGVAREVLVAQPGDPGDLGRESSRGHCRVKH